MKNKIAVLLLTLGLSTNTFATAIGCTGNIQALAFSLPSTILQVNLGFGMWNICAFSSTVNGVPADTCKAWYSMLLTAKQSGNTVTFDFDNGTTTLQCSQIGNWASPNPMPYFIQIN
jgi:hypothetical protein